MPQKTSPGSMTFDRKAEIERAAAEQTVKLGSEAQRENAQRVLRNLDALAYYARCKRQPASNT